MTQAGAQTKLIISPEEISARVAELAREIESDSREEKLLMLGVLKGAFIFMGDLVRHISRQVEVDFVRLASYGASTESSGNISLIKPPEVKLHGADILVVEDIVDTGLTLHWFRRWLLEQGAGRVRFCALIDKTERRSQALDLDYVGFTLPGGFLVGYGLDYNECYRHLPGIYELKFPTP